MELFRLAEASVSPPGGGPIATFSLAGSWDRLVGERCEVCGKRLARRISPAVMSYNSDSGLELRDVSFSGFAAVLVEESDVWGQIVGADLGPVHVEGDCPVDTSCVVELLPQTFVEADVDRSSFDISKSPCAGCGRHVWGESRPERTGVERMEMLWDSKEGTGKWVNHRRKPGRGLFVDEARLAGANFFRFPQASWVVATERAVEQLLGAGLTGVTFSSIGETFS